MKSTFFQIQAFLDKCPRFRCSLRKVRFIHRRKKAAFKIKFQGVNLDPNRKFWIDPRKITNVGVGWGKYKKLHEIGRIVAGNWDLNTMPFEDLNVYKAFKARFVHEARWEDTSYYKSILAQLASGMVLWEMHDKGDLLKRLGDLDCLFEEIRSHGYKMQQQLLGDRYSLSTLDEVTVRIGRTGEFFFEDGRHRLAIAKILGLPRIPVMVSWRHKEWYLFRAQILDFAKRHRGKIYQPITHPDLCDIPAAHGDTRFHLISANMSFKGGTLLDIGANWGYFCHRFEEEGFHCYAVEKGSIDSYFLNKLKIAEKRKFTVVHADIFEFWEKSDFDVVLALNIFHHFLKTADGYKKLVKFLRRLKTRVIFFEPHLPDETQMCGAYRNFDNEQFVHFVAENTNLTQWKCIGYAKDNRPIYKLTKS